VTAEGHQLEYRWQCAICLGSWVSPSLFLGALLVNLTTKAPLTPSIGIGVGNTIEAPTGAYLVRHFAGAPAIFYRIVDALKFLLLVAVSASSWRQA
jgi:integral membrane sensor domain MASE1